MKGMRKAQKVCQSLRKDDDCNLGEAGDDLLDGPHCQVSVVDNGSQEVRQLILLAMNCTDLSTRSHC